MFQLLLVLSLDTTEKQQEEPGSLCPPHTYVYTLLRSPHLKVFYSLFQVEQSQFSQSFHMGDMLQSHHHPCGSSLDSLLYLDVSLVVRSPAFLLLVTEFANYCNCVCQGDMHSKSYLNSVKTKCPWSWGAFYSLKHSLSSLLCTVQIHLITLYVPKLQSD